MLVINKDMLLMHVIYYIHILYVLYSNYIMKMLVLNPYICETCFFVGSLLEGKKRQKRMERKATVQFCSKHKDIIMQHCVNQ